MCDRTVHVSRAHSRGTTSSPFSRRGSPATHASAGTRAARVADRVATRPRSRRSRSRPRSLTCASEIRMGAWSNIVDPRTGPGRPGGAGRSGRLRGARWPVRRDPQGPSEPSSSREPEFPWTPGCSTASHHWMPGVGHPVAGHPPTPTPSYDAVRRRVGYPRGWPPGPRPSEGHGAGSWGHTGGPACRATPRLPGDPAPRRPRGPARPRRRGSDRGVRRSRRASPSRRPG